MPENMRLLHNQLRTSQDKYVYFLLAVAASAIAFSVQITKASVFSYSLAPLGFAVLMWSISFYCGCKNIQYTNSTIYANGEYLKIQTGRHPEVGNNPSYIQAASEGIMLAMESNQKYVSNHGLWQFKLLVFGGVSFIGWHLVEMGLRTYGN